MDFESIYQSYFQDVYRYLCVLTENESLAEELTAETFFKALKSLNTFRGDCSVKIWLCRIAKNLWYSHCRRTKHIDDHEFSADSLSSSSDFIQVLTDRDTALHIHRILHGLNEPYREVFSLRVFGELPFQDIGDLFGKSAHWACVTYHRAKEKIQAQLGGCYE